MLYSFSPRNNFRNVPDLWEAISSPQEQRAAKSARERHDREQAEALKEATGLAEHLREEVGVFRERARKLVSAGLL